MTEHTQTPWMWAWRDDESAPASIFSMVREGHAYAVAMCPRYQKPEQWVADAKFIVKAVNSHDALVKALEKIIEMNRQHAKDEYGDAEKAESWACITVARKALSGLVSAPSGSGK